MSITRYVVGASRRSGFLSAFDVGLSSSNLGRLSRIDEETEANTMSSGYRYESPESSPSTTPSASSFSESSPSVLSMTSPPLPPPPSPPFPAPPATPSKTSINSGEGLDGISPPLPPPPDDLSPAVLQTHPLSKYRKGGGGIDHIYSKAITTQSPPVIEDDTGARFLKEKYDSLGRIVVNKPGSPRTSPSGCSNEGLRHTADGTTATVASNNTVRTVYMKSGAEQHNVEQNCPEPGAKTGSYDCWDATQHLQQCFDGAGNLCRHHQNLGHYQQQQQQQQQSMLCSEHMQQQLQLQQRQHQQLHRCSGGRCAHHERKLSDTAADPTVHHHHHHHHVHYHSQSSTADGRGEMCCSDVQLQHQKQQQQCRHVQLIQQGQGQSQGQGHSGYPEVAEALSASQRHQQQSLDGHACCCSHQQRLPKEQLQHSLQSLPEAPRISSMASPKRTSISAVGQQQQQQQPSPTSSTGCSVDGGRISEFGPLSEHDVSQVELFYRSHKTVVYVCPTVVRLSFSTSVGNSAAAVAADSKAVKSKTTSHKSSVAHSSSAVPLPSASDEKNWVSSNIYGVPLILHDLGGGRRSRCLSVIMAERGTGFELWRTIIRHLATEFQYQELNSAAQATTTTATSNTDGSRTSSAPSAAATNTTTTSTTSTSDQQRQSYVVLRCRNSTENPADEVRWARLTFVDNAQAAGDFRSNLESMAASDEHENHKSSKKSSDKDSVRKQSSTKKSNSVVSKADISQPCCFSHVTRLERPAAASGVDVGQQVSLSSAAGLRGILRGGFAGAMARAAGLTSPPACVTVVVPGTGSSYLSSMECSTTPENASHSLADCPTAVSLQ